MDMKGIKGKQDSIDSFLVNLRRENEALWREVALLRQKHQKQQQIVEKLIQFFLTLVHNRGLGLKRNFPLMIDSKNGGVGQLRVNMSPPQNSGPVIHDVTDHLLDEDCLANVSGSNGSSSNSTSDNGKMSNALIEENSKSPFSASEISESDLKAVANSAALDPLELAFAETQNDTNEILNNEEDALDPLDQLNSVQPDDLLPLEPPLIDPTSLVEESVIAPPANDSIKPPILNATDPLQLESNAGNTTRSPSQSANNSLVPSTSSVLNTPTYTM